jgi:hypothetical protein
LDWLGAGCADLFAVPATSVAWSIIIDEKTQQNQSTTLSIIA